jgi:hypothetical protein
MAFVVMNNTRKSVHRRPSYSIEYGRVVTGHGMATRVAAAAVERQAGVAGNVWKSSVTKRLLARPNPQSRQGACGF